MHHKPTVFIVDDDPAMRSSLRWLVESVGLHVQTYPSADHRHYRPWGCGNGGAGDENRSR